MTNIVITEIPGAIEEIVVGVPSTPTISASTVGPVDEVVSINGSITVVDVLLAPAIDTVEVIKQGPPGVAGADGTALVEMTFTSPTLGCLRIAGMEAYAITSLDVELPACDGVLLESGNDHDFRKAAIGQGLIFDSPLSVPGADSAALYLGQSGGLTTTVPTAAAGDIWFYPIARRVSASKFIYDPGFPTKLQ